jgi:hypothetical protein
LRIAQPFKVGYDDFTIASVPKGRLNACMFYVGYPAVRQDIRTSPRGRITYGSTEKEYFSAAQALKVSVRTADALVSDQEITGVRLRG